jgi:surface antigen
MYQCHCYHYCYYCNDYYYGQKWQCVEYAKRFYDQVLNHRMPNAWGHAKDFFDEAVEQGGLNSRRGLIQFRNRGDTSPAVHDILVFSDTLHGHLAIISDVSENAVEVVQQNIVWKPRETFGLTKSNGTFVVHSPRIPNGWLRIE